MSDTQSIHDILCNVDWDLEVIESLLRFDSSSVNVVEGGLAPLHRVLKDRRCSVDIVEVVLRYGADANLQLGYGGPTPLILGLHCRDRVGITKALVQAGAKADNPGDPTLNIALALDSEMEVIQLLLQAGADFIKADSSGECPLVHALGYKNFSVSSFRTLLDLQVVDINAVHNQWTGSLLHTALQMDECPASFVQFLIERGIAVDYADSFGNTPLHVAVQSLTCQPGVIIVLLKRGAPVNTENKNGETPLELALRSECTLTVVKLLLDAGASLLSTSSFALETTFLNFNSAPEWEPFNIFLLLLKYSFLECPELALEAEKKFRGHILHSTFLAYSSVCMAELEKMKSENIGEGLTLNDFLKTYSAIQMGRSGCKRTAGGFDVDQIFKLIVDYSYPMYCDVISSKFERSLLEEKLEGCTIYSKIISPEMECAAKTVSLNSDCVLLLAEFLSDSDLLNLVLPF